MTMFRPLALTLSLVLTGACDDSSGPDDPTDPAASPIVFAGRVDYQGSNTHPLALTDSATVRIALAEVVPVLVEISDVTELNLTLGFSLGTFDGDDCVATFQTAIVEGDDFSFRLGSALYCLTIFDTGTLPEDAIIDYTLLVTQ